MTAPNTNPIFALTPNVAWAASIGTGTANTATDGTGTLNTNIWAVYTAGAQGSFLQRIRVKYTGTTGAASLLRVFINNGSSNGTASNNILYGEIPLSSVTGSNTSSLPDIDYPMNLVLPAGYRVLVTVATAITNGVSVSGIGGDY